MYLVEVAPLTKIPHQKPQILSYFSAHETPVGSLILAPLGKRFVESIVIETHQIKEHKMEIKKAEYELRPIKKIIIAQPVLTHQQIELAIWLSQYYFTSPGLFMKMMIPKKVQSSKFKVQNGNRKCKINKSQKLIIVPEVSQINIAQKKYPKSKTIIIHSGLKNKQLKESWQKIVSGRAKIIVGTRLAVFAPFVNLKEIEILDETNPHHRSWDKFPHWRVHEAAQKLAEIFNAKLILKSDLPSVESYYLTGQYGDVGCRADIQRQKIKTGLVDLRQELREGNYSIFSRKLQEAITEILKKGQPVILFINRRGAATFILCRDCGYVAKCPNCDAPTTYHLSHRRTFDDRQMSDGSNTNTNQLKPILICHHCGAQQEPPNLCPICQSYRIKAFGSGTQRVEQEAKKLFKEAEILRLDSDVAPQPKDEQKIIDEFKQKKANILIGTQMILNANLPKVPLVAIISADTLLHLPDFGSSERLFQTIAQLKKFSRQNFIIQTYNAETPVIQLAAENDFKPFYEQEIEARKILKYPPFSQLIKLIFRHQDPKKAYGEAKILHTQLTQQLKLIKITKEIILDLIGPAPAFIPKEKQKYIWQIIIKAKPVWLAPQKERQNLINSRNQFLMTIPSHWEIDVDPETLL